MGGKIGVMLEGTCSEEIAHDVALQIAAANPLYLAKEDVPAAALEKEKEILKAQALNEGKPAAIVDKMVVGRINKYYKDVCLLEHTNCNLFDLFYNIINNRLIQTKAFFACQSLST